VASRDFIYVDDIVSGLLAGASRGKAGEVYNLASGAETTIMTLASMINELTANPTPIERLPARPWDRSGHRFGSTDKAKEGIGFEAEVELRSGLERTIGWTRENMALIERCMQKHAKHMTV